jgi:hypothetical protein
MCRRITTAFTAFNHCKQRSKHRYALLMTPAFDLIACCVPRRDNIKIPVHQPHSFTSDTTERTRNQNIPPKHQSRCLLRPPLAPPARATPLLVAVPTPRCVLTLRHKVLISMAVWSMAVRHFIRKCLFTNCYALYYRHHKVNANRSICRATTTAAATTVPLPVTRTRTTTPNRTAATTTPTPTVCT